ncbi:MAG: hypothetical protein MJZ89_06875, partial [Paludibacteraceae bacterium]|nr:hypothetical protein [Paludibacteraceae bacterium]
SAPCRSSGRDSPTNHSNNMKKIIFFVVIILLGFSSCSEYKARKIAEQERAQFVKDSIARAEFVRDSTALANKRAQEARERRAQFVRDSTERKKKKKTIARCSKQNAVLQLHVQL